MSVKISITLKIIEFSLTNLQSGAVTCRVASMIKFNFKLFENCIHKIFQFTKDYKINRKSKDLLKVFLQSIQNQINQFLATLKNNVSCRIILRK